MSELKRRIKTGKRNFILALILLISTNIVMGVVLMTMSKHSLREQLEGRMLDVSNSAASQLNGDELKTVTPYQRDTEEYKRAYNTLTQFKNSIKLEYIYALSPAGDGTYVYGIDPDTEDPAEPGEFIEMTDALRSAATGKAAVEKKPHTDEWGRFYSAYSPFYDSEGNIVGIVGVDFNADDYDSVVNSHRAVAVILVTVAMIIGIILSFIIMSQNRKRFASMIERLSDLETEMRKLDDSIMKTAIKKLDLLPDSQNEALKTLAAGERVKVNVRNEYDEMNTSIEAVYNRLRKYVGYVDKTAYTDDITGTLNKAAYRQKIAEIDEAISKGEAVFSIAFFDIDGIKKVYTHYGFEAGEELMFECAKLLNEIFGRHNVFHITGDEFVVIMDGKERIDVDYYFAKFEKKLNEFNSGREEAHKLSISKGAVTFDSSKHKNYRQVFVDTKEAADKDKEYHYASKREISAYS